ncbi:MAG TPA: proprotein convertase P-domain-containing protein, partial [Polyangium sp.]|nr:proprotein convertase P-domain-containing protein [Polyangium sp.]
MIDENIPGFGIPCSTGLSGACSAGTYSCRDGVADCYPDLPPAQELCDGLDNNCNGQIDENNAGGGGPCMTNQPGVCAQGKQVCMGGVFVCEPNTMTQAETCNGADDNCNGQTDEGNPGSGQACTCGGTTTCTAGKLVCQGCTKEFFCNNGTDDDGDTKVDCQDSDCSLACSTSVGPCAAGESLVMLRSTNIPKSITNGSTASSTIVINEALTITRVVMAVKISHTWDADLVIKLKSPAGTVRIMSDSNGYDQNNYTNTIFNSACTTPITSGSPPFTGCFAPEQSMTAFNNQSMKGTWTLSVTDQSCCLDVGTLDAWTLAICAK